MQHSIIQPDRTEKEVILLFKATEQWADGWVG